MNFKRIFNSNLLSNFSQKRFLQNTNRIFNYRDIRLFYTYIIYINIV